MVLLQYFNFTLNFKLSILKKLAVLALYHITSDEKTLCDEQLRLKDLSYRHES